MNDLLTQFNDGVKLAVKQQLRTKGADDEETFMHCCGGGCIIVKCEGRK